MAAKLKRERDRGHEKNGVMSVCVEEKHDEETEKRAVC